MKQEDSDGTVRIFSARACAAPLEKKKSLKQFGHQQLWFWCSLSVHIVINHLKTHIM